VEILHESSQGKEVSAEDFYHTREEADQLLEYANVIVYLLPSYGVKEYWVVNPMLNDSVVCFNR
jgi:hypothetical protein